MNDINQMFHAAQDAVREVVVKKVQHEAKIETAAADLRQRRQGKSTDALESRANAFFSNNDDQQHTTQTLEEELNRLRDELSLFDFEITRRRKQLSLLQGPYNDFYFAKLKDRDDAIKTGLAKALTEVAECARLEVELIDELYGAGAQAPACFRPMRPNFIGSVRDPNSWISLWLRELREYYPHLRVRESK